MQGQTLGKVRRVPNWWGEDANLASGVLVAAETAKGVEFLLAVESRPWWPTRQVGPLWGFVEAEDPNLTSAMAREAAEEGLEILGSQDQLLASLESSETSCPVSFWPWQSDTARRPRPAVLRMVSLGHLSPMQKGAVVGSFRKRRRHALAWAASLAVLAQPASHLEVEELIWVNSRSLLQEVQAGQVPWLGGSAGGPLRGFVGDLLREGQRWKRSARFRDFCRGNSEALPPMPHSRALVSRLVTEAGTAFCQKLGRSRPASRHRVRGQPPLRRSGQCFESQAFRT